jgi:gluconate 5-dehydrogenase
MADQLFCVKDKVTLVSGGSRGIGKAIASGFAQRDAKVIITGRNESTLVETANEISTETCQVVPIVCDVADVDSIKAAVAQVVERFGRIDTLVSVAGVNIRKPSAEFTPDEYDFVVDINQKGAFFIAQEVGRQMVEQGSGSIINIDSLNTYAPLKNVTPYAMSKAAVVMMTRSLALEWGNAGVRVNSIAPGFILTDLTKQLWSNPTMQDWGITNTPLARLGQPDDMIGAAVFLASDAAAFMTGQVVRVDGGFSAGMNWPIPTGGGQ